MRSLLQTLQLRFVSGVIAIAMASNIETTAAPPKAMDRRAAKISDYPVRRAILAIDAMAFRNTLALWSSDRKAVLVVTVTSDGPTVSSRHKTGKSTGQPTTADDGRTPGTPVLLKSSYTRHGDVSSAESLDMVLKVVQRLALLTEVCHANAGGPHDFPGDAFFVCLAKARPLAELLAIQDID